MTKEEEKSEKSEQTGYERSLFEDTKPKWSDDRIGGEKMEVRYHDKEMVLKVANGLCYDIFFRADDVYRPDFEEIPNFYEPVPEEEHKPGVQKKGEQKKPLDSQNKNRTYLLSPDEKEEPSRQVPTSRERKVGKRPPRHRGRRKPTNSSRHKRRGMR